jgi:DNA-directed RNA polymerase subunit RPC12/RpoP
MIRFACPACGKHLQVADRGAGLKVSCPGCGQRLLVPSPATPAGRDKTVLGAPLPSGERSTTAAAAPAKPAAKRPAGTVPATCPGCGRAIPLQPHELSLTIECARCGTWFVPSAAPAPAAPEDVLEEVPDAPTSACRSVSAPAPVPMAECPAKEAAVGGRVACTLLGASMGGTLGALVGCVVGIFAAHHFAFFGGFALIGEPYSPIRWELVPGHMLLCGILLGLFGTVAGGLAGFGIGWAVDDHITENPSVRP